MHRVMPILSPILYTASYVEDDNPSLAPPGCEFLFCIRPDTMTITYSPKNTSKQSEEYNAFALAHEAGHYLCDHMPRRKKMESKEGKSEWDFELWMMAEEMVVNRLIQTLSGWPIPEHCVKPIDGWESYTTEETYMELKKLPKSKQPRLPKVCTICIDSRGNATIQKSDGTAEMLKVQISEAAAKELKKKIDAGELKPGNLPGELRELATRFAPMKKEPDWREMLKRYMTSTDFNCKNFDPSQLYRRSLPLCLPNLSSHPVAKKFVVSIDNSGSVGDRMFECLCGIINSAAQQLGFQEIIVQHFTTQVMATERHSTLKGIKNIKRKADGGTALDDCDMRAAKHKGQFHIILTDGYVNWLDSYSLPTIIVRTVKDTQEPIRVRNMIGSVVAAHDEVFRES